MLPPRARHDDHAAIGAAIHRPVPRALRYPTRSLTTNRLPRRHLAGGAPRHTRAPQRWPSQKGKGCHRPSQCWRRKTRRRLVSSRLLADGMCSHAICRRCLRYPCWLNQQIPQRQEYVPPAREPTRTPSRALPPRGLDGPRLQDGQPRGPVRPAQSRTCRPAWSEPLRAPYPQRMASPWNDHAPSVAKSPAVAAAPASWPTRR